MHTALRRRHGSAERRRQEGLRVRWKDEDDTVHEVATLDFDALAAGEPLEVDLPETDEDEEIMDGTGEGESWPEPPPPDETQEPQPISGAQA